MTSRRFTICAVGTIMLVSTIVAIVFGTAVAQQSPPTGYGTDYTPVVPRPILLEPFSANESPSTESLKIAVIGARLGMNNLTGADLVGATIVFSTDDSVTWMGRIGGASALMSYQTPGGVGELHLSLDPPLEMNPGQTVTGKIIAVIGWAGPAGEVRWKVIYADPDGDKKRVIRGTQTINTPTIYAAGR